MWWPSAPPYYDFVRRLFAQIVDPLFHVPMYDKSSVWPGYTAFAFSFNSYVLMYDMEGRLAGARRTGTRNGMACCLPMVERMPFWTTWTAFWCVAC